MTALTPAGAPEVTEPGPPDELAATVRHALEVAASRRQFDTTGATPITVGVVRLPAAADGAGVIAKIHRTGTNREAALLEAAVASWVLEHGIPTARPLGLPTAVRSQMVSFSEDLGPGGTADPEERAVLLALLHALPTPTGLRLPQVAPAARLLRRLKALPVTVMNGAARREVWLHLQEVERLWKRREPLTRRRLIHGDINASNTVVGRDGIPRLINWRAAAVGPPGLDLATEAVRRDFFNADPRDYARFHTEYGHDITRDDTGRTYAVLAARAAAEGVITAAELAVHDPKWRPEYLLRLACLSGQGTPGFVYPWLWRTGSQLAPPPPPPGPSRATPATSSRAEERTVADSARIFMVTSRAFSTIAADIARLADGRVDQEFTGLDRAAVRLVEGPAGTSCAIEPNVFIEHADAPPDEHNAYDGYPVMVEIWQPNKDYDQLRAVARRVFDALAQAPGAAPLLLVWELEWPLAAFLPTKGVHDFPEGTSVDAEHRAHWEPWVAPRA
ncbi:phosphotransferase family protein [Kitasatospora sp. NPDC101801]|uniref:phosphotransferase family protein n=1 Tax=Kitasatospora sp. NPDC101801 TaxID=3364103 RepID=UPI003822CD3F